MRCFNWLQISFSFNNSRNRTILPDNSIEQELSQSGFRLIAGVDEAGRGPWAGPVVCAAVIIPKGVSFNNLNDSKKLSAEQREQLFELICRQALVAVAEASPMEIDKMNIRAATLWAMCRAVKSLKECPDAAIIDGRDVPPDLPCMGQAVIKGDSKSVSIAAASVVAKVTRDRIMTELAKEYPQYGFDRNKGYGTAVHAEAIKRFGVTAHHRKSYRPIRDHLESVE